MIARERAAFDGELAPIEDGTARTQRAAAKAAGAACGLPPGQGQAAQDQSTLRIDVEQPEAGCGPEALHAHALGRQAIGGGIDGDALAADEEGAGAELRDVAGPAGQRQAGGAGGLPGVQAVGKAGQRDGLPIQGRAEDDGVAIGGMVDGIAQGVAVAVACGRRALRTRQRLGVCNLAGGGDGECGGLGRAAGKGQCQPDRQARQCPDPGAWRGYGWYVGCSRRVDDGHGGPPR